MKFEGLPNSLCKPISTKQDTAFKLDTSGNIELPEVRLVAVELPEETSDGSSSKVQQKTVSLLDLLTSEDDQDPVAQKSDEISELTVNIVELESELYKAREKIAQEKLKNIKLEAALGAKSGQIEALKDDLSELFKEQLALALSNIQDQGDQEDRIVSLEKELEASKEPAESWKSEEKEVASCKVITGNSSSDKLKGNDSNQTFDGKGGVMTLSMVVVELIRFLYLTTHSILKW